MQSEHTPTPWRWVVPEWSSDLRFPSPGFLCSDSAPNGLKSILFAPYPNAGDLHSGVHCTPEDAAFIVTAVNAHEELVEALRASLAWCRPNVDGKGECIVHGDGEVSDGQRWACKARAVIHRIDQERTA